MTIDTDLDHCKVLVVEDDFFLATDTERAVHGAGGIVIGPVGREDQALGLIAREKPDCAVVDIDLGLGPQFDVSDALRAAAVPFLFVTGYDDGVIPVRFEGVERLRKPVDLRQMVRAVAALRSF